MLVMTTMVTTLSPEQSLYGFLVAEQAARRMSDAEFAALLGLSVDDWSSLREGQRPWPAAVVAKVLVRFPDALSLASWEIRRQGAPGEGWRPRHAAENDWFSQLRVS